MHPCCNMYLQGSFSKVLTLPWQLAIWAPTSFRKRRDRDRLKYSIVDDRTADRPAGVAGLTTGRPGAPPAHLQVSSVVRACLPASPRTGRPRRARRCCNPRCSCRRRTSRPARCSRIPRTQTCSVLSRTGQDGVGIPGALRSRVRKVLPDPGPVYRLPIDGGRVGRLPGRVEAGEASTAVLTLLR